MEIQPADIRPTREQALQIAERRKATRRWRTRRLRRGISLFSVAAFIAPFGVIFTQLAAGRDPALSSTHTAAATVSGATAVKAAAGAQAQSAGRTTSSGSTRTQITQSTQTTSPAPVTTQQS